MTPLVTDDTTVAELAALLRGRGRPVVLTSYLGGYDRHPMWEARVEVGGAYACRPTLAAALSALLEALPEVSP